MKKLITLSILLLLWNQTFAQISVSPKEFVKLRKGSFDAKHLALLKSTTTIFPIRTCDEPYIEEYQKGIRSSNPIFKKSKRLFSPEMR
jgi:hypothetical protein